MRPLTWLFVWFGLWPIPVAAQAIRVPPEQLRARVQAEADKGYNLGVVTQAGRYNAAVILSLAREARTRDPGGPPLLIHHQDWFAAYRDVTELTDEQVPEFMALQRDYQQDMVIHYDTAATSHHVEEGPGPAFVVRVEAGWPDAEGAADRYTFVDTMADPHMRVVNEREISYYLLDFGTMVVQDRIQGVGGRPLGGALGAAFSVIGDGWATQSRFAEAEDGTLVTYAKAKKAFLSVDQLSTTLPDGRVVEDTPEDRSDLQEIARELQQDLEVEYRRR